MTYAEKVINLLKESAPSGWEGTVKHMKKHRKITNPYALAYYMKKKGDTPHYKESGVKKEQYRDEARHY